MDDWMEVGSSSLTPKRNEVLPVSLELLDNYFCH